jgi:outer membrane receptor for ferric coprogen and ferric-rhodotorulic acid
MQSRPPVDRTFKRKTIPLLVALAIPAFVHAQETETVLPTVLISDQAAGQILGETTEGTGSYTTGEMQTATPLSLSPRETPQSVSVITQQRIEDQNFSNITDLLNSVTGVSVHQYETSRAQFTARGFDINTLMIDGVPTSWQQGWSSGEIMTSLAIYDRVEVVRGATGLTTGAGDPSAAINLVRKRASSKEFTGTVEAGIGSWNEKRLMADVSTPLNEAKTLRARVVGEYADSDSWVDKLSNKRETLFATIEADLTPTTLLSAGYSRQENNPTGSMWGGLPVWYSDGTRANWDRSKTTSADWVRWNSTYESYFASLEHQFDSGWKMKASYTHGERDADSRLLYLYGAPDRTTGLGLYTWPGSYLVNTTQEDFSLQANGPFDFLGREHQLAVGYTHAKTDFSSDSRSAAGGLAPSFNNWDTAYPEPTWGPLAFYGRGTTTQAALYGAARFSIADPLHLIVGARLTNYTRSADEIGETPFSLKIHNQLTPYAGVVYDINETYSAYASYTDIFQPQQQRDINGDYLDPILGKSTEIGVKGAFFGDRLNASAAIFEIVQDNLAQSTGQTIAGTTPPETAYRASQGATSRGFEFEVSGEVKEGWNVSAGYTQFKATDADGANVNTIYPRRLLRLFTSYRLHGDFAGLTLGGGVNWQSKTYTDAINPLGNVERITQDAYSVVNLMARYDFTKQLSAQLNINNVLDETYFAMFDAYDQMTYGAPRSATLKMTYKF